MNYYELGTTPYNEPCVQVNAGGYYHSAMYAEAQRYMHGLNRYFANCDKVVFRIKTFSHDFGNYYEVVAKYSDYDQESEQQACYCQDNAPATWTELESGICPVDFVYDKYEEDDEDA